ncbi:MAG: hypothetical protein M5U26_17845 [Planctomycetota bacterium]|nr:hypothetical protein [Planctomycetota bacterium]
MSEIEGGLQSIHIFGGKVMTLRYHRARFNGLLLTHPFYLVRNEGIQKTYQHYAFAGPLSHVFTPPPTGTKGNLEIEFEASEGGGGSVYVPVVYDGRDDKGVDTFFVRNKDEVQTVTI